MKRYLLVLTLAWVSLAIVPGSILSQSYRVDSGSPGDSAENIALSTITFDDIFFNNPDNNTLPISPNRYAGVSFYTPGVGVGTYLYNGYYLSYPNCVFTGYTVFGDWMHSVNHLVIDFAQASKDVSFWWGVEGGCYSSGTIEIYNDSLQLVGNPISVSLFSNSWHQFSLNQYHERIKRVILRRPDVFDDRCGFIDIENFTFTPVPDVQSVVFEPFTGVINGVSYSSAIDSPTVGPSSQRIFPDKQSPFENINRKTVRVKAVVGQPNVWVYFKNFDVDDPSSNPDIDENGSLGNDNREGRTLNPPFYPTSARGVFSECTATSYGCKKQTDSNGVAIVYFSVTKQPGDNFVVAASTSETYLDPGVTVSGTELKDAANNTLPTPQAKRTQLLTVWRKLYLETDTMASVADNFITGYVRGKGVSVGSQPTWVEVYPSTGLPLSLGYIEPNAYKGTAQNGYGGRIVVAGGNVLHILDNEPPTLGRRMRFQVVSLSGSFYLYPNQPLKIYDDDDFNTNDGLAKDGDDAEDVNLLPDTFSILQTSDDRNLNPFADAYIVPDHVWAFNQGINNPNVSFVLHSPCSLPHCPQQRSPINLNRGSQTLERDDFWIAYVLVSYQGDPGVDVDGFGFLGGVAPLSEDNTRSNADHYSEFIGGVPPGGIGAVIFIEAMRDHAITPLSESFLFPRTRIASHEVGHQFGLAHNDNVSTGGIMSRVGNSYFTSNHINMMRWRVKSPGEGQ